ncbi:LysM peptidoglycan-binding domain-containing protein [Gorillibacterium timonense]|uniref:LysM peptidoglycan-binding domain-containing protein n=1 Tax=Gorillibacterium timonense TaxID=1689269 RepID=UPI00071C7FFF|nr:LysM domain-containing protein [Gorillibacterium timonense]
MANQVVKAKTKAAPYVQKKMINDNPVAIYLSFNNQEDGFMLPVLPASLEISNGGNDSTYETSVGEIQVIKNPKLPEYKLESLFPYQEYPFITAFQYAGEPVVYTPMEYVAYLEKWMRSKKPIRFVYTGTGYSINETVSITSFNWKEVAGSPGDIEYDLSLKRYVFYGARLAAKTSKTDKTGKTMVTPAGVSKTNPRPAKETPKTYKLKAGDTLWKIAQTYGLTVAVLQKLNKISDAETRKLAIGREIKLQ